MVPTENFPQLSPKYRLLSRLGDDVVAISYKGIDLENNREVVIKVLKPEMISRRMEDFVRCKKEIERLIKIDHPHIAKLYSIEEGKENYFIVGEPVAGEMLAALFKQNKKFSLAESAQIIAQITAALEAAHAHNLLHLDVRPVNIILDNQTNNCKLSGFAQAQLFEYVQIKSSEDVKRVFAYLSPEQAGTLKRLPDERSDLYCLGIIFYQLLTGELPFSAATVTEILYQHIGKTAVSPRKINPLVPPLIEEMVLKLMVKEPEVRYQTAQGLAADLQSFRRGETSFPIGRHDRVKKLLFHSRLIGREEELQAMKNSFTKTFNGEGTLCLLSSEAGRGKSRLAEEMRNFIYEQRGVFIAGRCINRKNKTPYQLFHDLLADYLYQIKRYETQQREKTVLRLKTILADLGEVIVKINPQVKELLGEQPALVPLDQEREQTRFLMVAAKFFLNLGTPEEPYTLYLDDLHWADEASLLLLVEIISELKHSYLFILGTYRDTEVTEQDSLYKLVQRARKENYSLVEIHLELFDQPKLNKFIAELLLVDEQQTEKLSYYVFEKSKGNSFFSLEIVRQLVDEKALTFDGDLRCWHIDWEKINGLSVSANIVDIVLKRLDRLEPETLSLLSFAAIIGREFSIELLNRLVPLSPERIILLLDELVFSQLLEKSGERGKLLFAHDRIRDACSAMVSTERLKEIHLRIATGIEQIHEHNKENVVFALAHHYSEADVKNKSLEYALPAARYARQNFAHEEAEKYYTLAIKILSEQGQKNSPLLIVAKEELSETYLVIGKNDQVIDISQEILPYKESALEKAKMYGQIGTAYFKKGCWLDSEGAFARCFALLEEKLPLSPIQVVFSLLKEFLLHVMYALSSWGYAGKKLGNLKAQNAVSLYMTLNWMYILSDVLKFARSVLRMLNIATAKIGKSRELATALGAYASLNMAIPLFNRALKYHYQALDMKKELADEWGVAQSLQFIGYCHEWRGQYAKSLDAFERSLSIFEKIGDIREIGMTVQGIGFDHFYAADYKKALAAWEKYEKMGEKTKDVYALSNSWAAFARVYIQTGALAKAEVWLRRALSLSEQHKVWFIHCYANIHMGHLLVLREKYSEALEYLQRAVKLDKENTFLRNYVCFLYCYLAEAYIGEYQQRVAGDKLSPRAKRRELRKIKKSCRKAWWQTRFWKNHYGQALRVKAKYYLLIDNSAKAKVYFEKAIAQTKMLGRKYEWAKTLYEYGYYWKCLGQMEQATSYWQQGSTIFKEIGAAHYQEKISKNLGARGEESERAASERLTVERRLNTLITVSQDLSSTLELEGLLNKIMEAGIKVSGAERGFLILYDKYKNDWEVKTAQGLDPEIEIIQQLDYRKYKISQMILDKVRNSGEAVLFSAESSVADEEIKSYRVKSIICSPLKIHNGILGILYLDNCLTEDVFDERDLNLINTLAVQAGIALQNAYFVREMVEKERLAEEIKLGRQIQTALLPHESPTIEGLKVIGLMLPAKEIGGDYYDYIITSCKSVEVQQEDKARYKCIEEEKENASTSTPASKLAVVIGDVSGKGVGAGLVMAMAKTAVHAVSEGANSPKEVLVKTNRILHRHINGEKFMTMLYFEWDSASRKMRYSSAGHEHIIVYRCRDVGVQQEETARCRDVEQKPEIADSRSTSVHLYSSTAGLVEVIPSGGFMLGMLPEIENMLKDNELNLKVGDKLILYTDGITEARNPKEEMYSLERLKEAVQFHGDKPVEELIAALKDEVKKFVGTREQYDDITLVGMEIE